MLYLCIKWVKELLPWLIFAEIMSVLSGKIRCQNPNVYGRLNINIKDVLREPIFL